MDASNHQDARRPSPAPAHRIVAMTASAGGVQALSTVLSALPANFPAPIVVVQHLDPNHRSLLPEILERRCSLRIKQAQEGDPIEPSTAYIAPPDQHLLVNGDGTLSLSHSDLVHFVRPSADLLFESVAATYQNQAIAVVLTGTGSDGTMGVRAIHKMGGLVLVEDPETADFAGMPRAAFDTGVTNQVLPLEEIADRLIQLVAQVPQRE